VDQPVTMPQLGESVTEGTIARWLKAEGDEVALDEALAEVDTDKVNAELPSPVAGRIEKLLVSEGTTVGVGTEIALVALPSEEGHAGPAPPRENPSADAPTEEFPAAGTEAQPVASGAADRNGHANGGTRANGHTLESAERLRLTRSSPVVRRLAGEYGLDLSEVEGTGAGGRVTKKDIEGHIARIEAARTATPEAPPATERATAVEREAAWERVTVYGGDRVVGLTGIRRTIANRMSRSKREAPHAWTMVEADVTGLVALRESLKGEFAGREGLKLTYLPFVVGAVAEGLKEHPILNSVWDGDRIVLRRRINVGIAVDREDGLVVPVLHDADELNTLGLARRIDHVVRRAREGRLSPDDVSGGTFTVNNPGALGSVVSVPIINYPQVAILSVEAIIKRPVIIDDAIAIRSVMNLEVSFDHRVTDGGAVLRFLNGVKRRLEGLGPDDAGGGLR
jgi:2-oxoisovalerate dehydrogenase E2 component (dihydrolipoyl transacylase)